MSKASVLIAAPIGDGKEYSINEWFNWIAEQPYVNYDVALCVNGLSEESVIKKRFLLEQVEIRGKKLKILQLEYNKYHTKVQKLLYSREIIREYAVKHDYDYIFWLDTDTIPQISDAIKLLIDTKKSVVSGLYFYKGTRQSVIIDNATKTNMTFSKIKNLIDANDVIKVWGFGYGCLLMHKSVFGAVPFVYEDKRENWSEDFVHCEAMQKKGIDRWFYARIICKHYHKKDFVES